MIPPPALAVSGQLTVGEAGSAGPEADFLGTGRTGLSWGAGEGPAPGAAEQM